MPYINLFFLCELNAENGGTVGCEIWGFHNCEDSSRGVLGCETM